VVVLQLEVVVLHLEVVVLQLEVVVLQLEVEVVEEVYHHHNFDSYLHYLNQLL
jgi:hypothetical protein